jgi:hypothetical protein
VPRSFNPTYPTRFAYTIGSSTLDRVDSITIPFHLDSKMTFKNHIDGTIAKGFAMLGFIKRLSKKFQDPYTLKSLYMSLVRSRLDFACCVWQPYYAIHIVKIGKIERKKFKRSSSNTCFADLDGILIVICRYILVV